MEGQSLEEPFVLTSWVNALLAGFNMDGYEGSAIISESGIDPALLEKGYCSLATLVAVFDAAQTLYGDYVSVSSNKAVTPSSFRSLSIALLSSETLADSFGLLVKHNAIITNAMSFIVDNKGGGRFGFSTREGLDISLPIASAVLSRALRTASFICPSAKLVTKVELSYEKPENASIYDQYFNAPVEWNCSQNSIYFDESAFNCRSTQADLKLRDSAEKNWLDEVSHFNDCNFMRRVNVFVKANLGGTRLTIESMASKFGMSVRTVQRRLGVENTSFSKLIDSIRKEEAQVRIKNTRESITDVAFSLGFSDVGSFSRAFRRWFDLSPEQYRKQQS